MRVKAKKQAVKKLVAPTYGYLLIFGQTTAQSKPQEGTYPTERSGEEEMVSKRNRTVLNTAVLIDLPHPWKFNTRYSSAEVITILWYRVVNRLSADQTIRLLYNGDSEHKTRVMRVSQVTSNWKSVHSSGADLSSYNPIIQEIGRAIFAMPPNTKRIASKPLPLEERSRLDAIEEQYFNRTPSDTSSLLGEPNPWGFPKTVFTMLWRRFVLGQSDQEVAEALFDNSSKGAVDFVTNTIEGSAQELVKWLAEHKRSYTLLAAIAANPTFPDDSKNRSDLDESEKDPDNTDPGEEEPETTTPGTNGHQQQATTPVAPDDGNANIPDPIETEEAISDLELEGSEPEDPAVPDPDEDSDSGTSEETDSEGAKTETDYTPTLGGTYESSETISNPPKSLQPELVPPEQQPTIWRVSSTGFRYPKDCPRCPGSDNMSSESDWYGESAACLNCGYVYEQVSGPPIEPLEEEESTHRQRRRQPSHGKIRL